MFFIFLALARSLGFPQCITYVGRYSVISLFGTLLYYYALQLFCSCRSDLIPWPTEWKTFPVWPGVVWVFFLLNFKLFHGLCGFRIHYAQIARFHLSLEPAFPYTLRFWANNKISYFLSEQCLNYELIWNKVIDFKLHLSLSRS